MKMASLDTKVFHPDIETIEEFLQRFKLQNYETLHRYRNDETKKAMLLANTLPIAVITDIQRRLQPKLLQDATYEDIETHLTASYGVKKSLIGASVAFHTRKQQAQESIEQYANVLNQLASKCGFSDCCRDRNLRDVFVSGLSSSKLISALITDCEKKKFHECVEKAKMMEQIILDIEDINQPQTPVKPLYQYKLQQPEKKADVKKQLKSIPPTYTCIRCGQKANHWAQDCFALHKSCYKCGKVGHLSSVCRSDKSKSHHIDEDTEDDNQCNYVVMNKISAKNHSHNQSNRADAQTPRGREVPTMHTHTQPLPAVARQLRAGTGRHAHGSEQCA